MSADDVINRFFDIMGSMIAEDFSQLATIPEINDQEENNDHSADDNSVAYAEDIENPIEDTVTDVPVEALEIINEETIDSIRYIVECLSNSEQDKTLQSDTIRWWAYFIPDYKIEIKVRSYGDHLSTVSRETVTITSCDEPKNSFQIDYTNNVYSTKLEKFKISKKWVEACKELWLEEQKVEELKNKLFFTAPNSKTLQDVIADTFGKGMKCFESADYNKGRTFFLECLDLLKKSTIFKGSMVNLCQYNISCCYAREKNYEIAMVYLHEAVKNGYNNWSHAIIDKDMMGLLDLEDFVLLIKEMKSINPKRQVAEIGVIKSINAIDVFLKKHNIL